MHMNMRDWLTGPDLCASRDVLCELEAGPVRSHTHSRTHTAIGTAAVGAAAVLIEESTSTHRGA